MASSLVDRATSSMLIGPDWAMNTEICEMLNRDLAQSKDVVKGLRRRLKSKNPKVQLLALTLLETVIKNCGDSVHMHVAEKDVLNQMVKMVKKKPDFHVKEKILVLIDTWQEAFGGPRARYPQYYAAYQELLHAGAVFPQRPERSASVLTPSQAQSRFNPDQQEAPESSAGSDLPILSLMEIQNARGIMDVLAEMLNALNPANKEGLREEVIVDLVGQCRSYKRRVFHLVNTSTDEELLSLGLALNDDLQRVLAKHDAIAAGIAVRQETPKSPPALVDVGEADRKTAGTSTEQNGGSSTSAGTPVDPFQQLLLTAEPHSDEKIGSVEPPTKVVPHMDLLSWDDADVPTTNNALAVVPVNEPPAPSTSDQNALALTALDNPTNSNNANNSFDLYSSYTAQQIYSTANGLQMPPPEMHSNGGVPNSGLHQYEQTHHMQGSQLNHANHLLNGHAAGSFNLQQQQSLTLGTNDQGGAFPPPPWETQPTQGNQLSVSQPQQTQSTHSAGLHPQMMQRPQLPDLQSLPMQSSQVPGMSPYPMQGGQMGGMQLQQPMQVGQMMGMHFQQAMQGGQMTGMQMQQAMLAGQMANMQLQQQAMEGSQMGGYAYAQQPGVQYYDQMRPGYPFANQNEISQRMYGISMNGNGGQMNMNPSSYQMSTSSSLPPQQQQQQPMRPAKPEDKLFGDLVNIAKVKQNKA